MCLKRLSLLALAVPLVACEPNQFYSVGTHSFQAVGEMPARSKLVGPWRSGRDSLVLLPTGKFTRSGQQGGCWDVLEGTGNERLLFVLSCVNYGNESVVLALREASVQCAFTLGEKLRLRDCEFAGEYRRE